MAKKSVLIKKRAEARAWHTFFCISLGIEPTRIVVFERWPKWMKEESSTVGLMFFDLDAIAITLPRKGMSEERWISTIAHETYHLYQLRKGLIHKRNGEWFYKKRKMDTIDRLPWSRRSYEVAAIRYAKKIINNFKE